MVEAVTPFLDPERAWLASTLPLCASADVQFWVSLVVICGCVAQLHLDRKFVWPPSPGRCTIWGYEIGLRLRSARWALRLADFGRYGDFAMTLVGRVGVAGQGALAVFALDDALAQPDRPHPILVWTMISIVLIQLRSLTTASPPNIIKLRT